MKKEKRVHAKSSKLGVETQSQNAPVQKSKTRQVKPSDSKTTTAIPAAQNPPEAAKAAPATLLGKTPYYFALNVCRMSAQLAVMVCEQRKKIEAINGDVTRLNIVDNTINTLVLQSGRLLTESPFNGKPLNCDIEPFGPVKASHEVEMARRLVDSEWTRCQAIKASDALGGDLPVLNYSIRYHPGLRTESAALDNMNTAGNELIGLMSAAKDGRWDGRKLTGAELWFAKQLSAAHERPFADFLIFINDALAAFDRDSRMARVSNAIRALLDGENVFGRVRDYLEEI